MSDLPKVEVKVFIRVVQSHAVYHQGQEATRMDVTFEFIGAPAAVEKAVADLLSRAGDFRHFSREVPADWPVASAKFR